MGILNRAAGGGTTLHIPNGELPCGQGVIFEVLNYRIGVYSLELQQGQILDEMEVRQLLKPLRFLLLFVVAHRWSEPKLIISLRV